MFLYFGLALVGIGGFFFTTFMTRPTGFYVFVITAALAGLGVAANINSTKRSGAELVCPTGSDCNSVVNSRYSKFFGLPLEYWGLTYFALIIAAYLILIFWPGMLPGPLLVVLMLLTMGGALFSLYLLFIQAFIVRAWCIWCILEALMSLTVFSISIAILPVGAPLLAGILPVIDYLRFVGYALGIGAGSAAVFMFFHFLKDSNIDDRELEVIKGIFELVWFGFILAMISQFVIYAVHADLLAGSGPFIAQTFSLLVAAFAGGILMLIFTPYLVFVPFKKSAVANESWQPSFGENIRHPTFAIWAIAIASWYFSLAMTFVRSVDLVKLLIIYASVLILAVGVSFFLERQIVKHGTRNP